MLFSFVKLTIEELGIIVGIIASVVAGCRFVYLKFKEQQLKYRTKLNGNWTNEGVVGEVTETHYLHMSLTADIEDGEITGLIESCSLGDDDAPNFTLSVNGKMYYKSAKVRFTKVAQGRVSNLGEATLTFAGTKILKWRIAEDVNGFFPSKTMVWTTEYNHFIKIY